MTTVKIQMDTVMSRIDKPKLVSKRLILEREAWYKVGMRKKKHIKKIELVQNGVFHSGFVSRIRKYLKKHGHSVKVKKLWDFPLPKKHKLKKGILRDYQEKAVMKMLKKGRGIWAAPPRAGKTYMAAGFISAFPKKTTVTVMVHTIDLLEQMVDDLKKFFKDDVGYLGAGKDKRRRIMVVTRQTFMKKLLKTDYDSDIVIVDECHHVGSFSSQYAKILTKLESPVRIGLTATPSKEHEASLACEAFIGPKIGETAYEELIEKKSLVKPKLKFLRVPETDKYKEIRGGYKAVYDAGIVKNRKRNLMIVNYAAKSVKKGKATLILVESIEHGKRLLDLLNIKAPDAFVYLQGKSKSEERMKEKLALGKRERLGVIATRIWTEGVTIPALDVVINAAGGLSEIMVIQKFGRGMGTYKGKKRVILVDFIDTNHWWFQRHSLSRICYYSDWSWL